MDAAAYTSGTTVVLPPEHGPIDGQRAQALLSHELVHVRQQQRMGPVLPPEDSPAGRELEDEARAAETGSAPLMRSASASSPHSEPSFPVVGSRSAPAGEAGQEQTASRRATHGAPGLAFADMSLARGVATAAQPAEGPDLDGGITTMTLSPPQRAEAGEETISSDDSGDTDDSDEAADLDELSGKLYDRIAHRLRRELLLDRERSGVLIDIG